MMSELEEGHHMTTGKITTAGGTERKTIPVRLPTEMHQEIKLLALFTGRSVNDIITSCPRAPGRTWT